VLLAAAAKKGRSRRDEKNAHARGLDGSPRPLGRGPGDPEQQGRGEQEISNRVPEPPCGPDLAVIRPRCEAGKGKCRDPNGRAHDRAQARGEADEFDEVSGARERTETTGEAIDQPGADEAFERVPG